MNTLKKSIALLVALSFMPSPKAAAEESSYGIKIGGATSYMIPPDLRKGKKRIPKLLIKSSPRQTPSPRQGRRFRIW